MGAGNFGVSFLQDQTPSEVIDTIQEWGHIVITPQEMNPDLYDDSAMLASARYTGIVLSKSLEEGVVQVSGQGLQLYLGDDRGKGMVIAENKNLGKARTYTDLPLSSVLFQSSTPYGIMRNEAGNLQAITQGTIYDGSSTYSGTHFVETSLHALKHICEDLGYEFRVNQDATVDAGPAANLFTGVNSDPTTVVVKTGYGDDPTYQGLSPTGARTEFDAADYVTKVDFIAEIGAFNDPTDFEGEASKTSGEIPYYDIHGNKLSRTGLVSVPDMDSDKLDEQAGLMLTELSKIKKVLNLDLEQYEVTGDLKVGDFIFAFDPFIGFTDNETDATAESRDIYEISFRGQQINPVKVRVVGLSFPISTGMGVYYRKFDGTNVTYTDLTPYVSFENGDTQVELGDVLRDVSDDLRFNEYSIAARTASAKSIPDLPSTPTLQSGTYQDGTGESKGFVRIVFSKPSNIDGSNIVDGSHYRVRYRISDGLSTSGGTSANEYTFKDFPFTGSSTESLVISDLTVGKAYRVGVATVDTSSFRRKSDYTASGEDLYTDSPSVNPNYTTNAIIEIDRDGQAPSKPKQAQSIAAGPLRVQLTHYLGKEGTDGSGNPFGDFTLEGDVDHLDIHAVTQSGNTASFTTNTANKIGEIRVTSGNILQQIPVIGTMELEDSQDYYFRIVAVDKSGNESDPSDGQSALANLIAEANIADATITTAKIGEAQITNALIADATITSAKINDLTADKITAGTIDASVITVTNLDASNITSGTITADRISGGTLDFNSVTAGNLDFSSLSVQAGDIVAEIANNEITDALIGDVSVSKLTSGSIVGNSITLGSSLNTSGSISSHNFSSGSAGFSIDYDGDAEFNNVIVRGTLNGVTVDQPVDIDFSSGGKIRTSSSGARVEIKETAGFPAIDFYGNKTTSLYDNQAGQFSIISNGEIELSGTDGIHLGATVINLGDKTGTLATRIAISGDHGGSTDVIKSNGNNAYWGTLTGGGVNAIQAVGDISVNSNTGSVVVNNNHSHNLGVNNNQADPNHHSNDRHNVAFGTSNINSSDVTNNSTVQTAFNHANSSHVSNNSINLALQNHTPNQHDNNEHSTDFASLSSYNNHLNNLHFSDQRLKNDVQETTFGLDFINRLRPVDFTWDSLYLDTYYDEEYFSELKSLLGNQQQGFIAQEVKQAVYDTNQSNTDFGGFLSVNITEEDQLIKDETNTTDDINKLDYLQFIGPLVKSVQQLSAKIDVLEARIDELEG